MIIKVHVLRLKVAIEKLTKIGRRRNEQEQISVKRYYQCITTLNKIKKNILIF